MYAQTLDRLASAATAVDGVRVGDLQPGDCLVVLTRNSKYVLRANADGTFDAAGGWFDLQDSAASTAGLRRRVVGCTWGGSALLTRMVAAPGMFLEFDNHLRTTRVREVRHLRAAAPPSVH